MINIYKRASIDEGLSKIDKYDTGAWISAVNPSAEEITELSKELNIEEDVFKLALDEDEKPRIQLEETYKLIIIRVAYGTDESEINVTPLTIIVTQKHLVTISLREIEELSHFLKKLPKNFFTTKKTRFFLQILSRANGHFQKVLADIEKKIETKEKLLLKSMKNEEIVELLDIQKSLLYINTAVASNDKVLERILNGKVLKLFDEDEDLLESIIYENKESIEMVNIYTNILANTMDAYASIINNNVNIVMKFLASVTIIIAIPSIVASFYGMNVDIPFESSPFAFVYVIVISVILTIIPAYYFAKKGYF
ncbi:MAG: magnesium transporter CorA family protein [archaeon]